MNILKLVGHLGVDRMLKEALGDSLTILRASDENGPYDVTGWMPDYELPFKVVREVPRKKWDFIIIDDTHTHHHIQRLGLQAHHMIWYVHGTYHVNHTFQAYANREFKGYAPILTDLSRSNYIVSWYKNPIRKHLVLPICALDDQFVFEKRERNGKVCIVGNCIERVYPIYGKEDDVKAFLRGLEKQEAEIYGYAPFPPEISRLAGYTRIKNLYDFSASAHVSYVRTLGFALLECMAAGIPVVTTVKMDLPLRLSGKAFVTFDDPKYLLNWVKNLRRDPDLADKMGIAGQKFLKDHLSLERYRERIWTWLKSFS